MVYKMHVAIQQLIEKIKKAREGKNLTQQQLAVSLGIPQGHLSRIENGAVNPRLSSFIEMARMLDLEVMLVPRQKILLVNTIIESSEKIQKEEIGPAYIPDKGDDHG